MRRAFLILVSYSLIVSCRAYANNCDTLQCINDIEQVLNNATIIQTTYDDWEGEWSVDEWQQIKYMPGEDEYTYFHKREKISVTFHEKEGVVTIEGYQIVLSDCSQSVIDVKPQWANNTQSTQDYVYGILALVNRKIYLHLHIIGTQDFEVDIYGVSDTKDITDIENNLDCRKLIQRYLYNGQLHIQHGDKIYIVQGTEVK